MNLAVSLGIAAVAVAAGLACSPAPAGILVTVSSDLRVPEDINNLVIRVRDDADELMVDEFVDLPGPAGTTLPATFGLQTAARMVGNVTIEVVGRRGIHPLVSRRVRTAFPVDRVLSVELVLAHKCVARICSAGQTCVSGTCVPYDSRVAPPARREAPPCNCNSYFPFCVDADWTIDVYPGSSGPTGNKTWKIISYQGVSDDRCGLAEADAFLLILTAGADRSKKWLQVDDVDGHQRLWWLKEDWFSTELDPVPATTYCYFPPKLRLDESRISPSEDWPPLTFRRDILEMDSRTPEAHVDRWKVVTPEEVKRAGPIRSRYPEKQFAGADIICHFREDRAPGFLEEKYFCFARGIGKIYELDVGRNTQEVLASWALPGCPRTIPLKARLRN